MTLHIDCMTSKTGVGPYVEFFLAHYAVLDKASDTLIRFSFQCVRHTYQNNTVNTVPVSLGYGRQLGLTEYKDHSLLVYQ